MKRAGEPSPQELAAVWKAAVGVDLPAGLESRLESAVGSSIIGSSAIGSSAYSASTSTVRQQPGAASSYVPNVTPAQTRPATSRTPSSASATQSVGTSPPAAAPLAARTLSSGISTSPAEGLTPTTTETSLVTPKRSQFAITEFYNLSYIPMGTRITRVIVAILVFMYVVQIAFVAHYLKLLYTLLVTATESPSLNEWTFITIYVSLAVFRGKLFYLCSVALASTIARMLSSDKDYTEDSGRDGGPTSEFSSAMVSASTSELSSVASQMSEVSSTAQSSTAVSRSQMSEVSSTRGSMSTSQLSTTMTRSGMESTSTETTSVLKKTFKPPEDPKDAIFDLVCKGMWLTLVLFILNCVESYAIAVDDDTRNMDSANVHVWIRRHLTYSLGTYGTRIISLLVADFVINAGAAGIEMMILLVLHGYHLALASTATVYAVALTKKAFRRMLEYSVPLADVELATSPPQETPSPQPPESLPPPELEPLPEPMLFPQPQREPILPPLPQRPSEPAAPPKPLPPTLPPPVGPPPAPTPPPKSKSVAKPVPEPVPQPLPVVQLPPPKHEPTLPPLPQLPSKPAAPPKPLPPSLPPPARPAPAPAPPPQSKPVAKPLPEPVPQPLPVVQLPPPKHEPTLPPLPQLPSKPAAPPKPLPPTLSPPVGPPPAPTPPPESKPMAEPVPGPVSQPSPVLQLPPPKHEPTLPLLPQRPSEPASSPKPLPPTLPPPAGPAPTPTPPPESKPVAEPMPEPEPEPSPVLKLPPPKHTPTLPLLPQRPSEPAPTLKPLPPTLPPSAGPAATPTPPPESKPVPEPVPEPEPSPVQVSQPAPLTQSVSELVAKPEPEPQPEPEPVPEPIPAPEITQTFPTPPPHLEKRKKHRDSPRRHLQQKRRGAKAMPWKLEFLRTQLLELGRGTFRTLRRATVRRGYKAMKPESTTGPTMRVLQHPRTSHNRPGFFKTPELDLNAAFETVRGPALGHISRHALERESQRMMPGENRPFAATRLALSATFKPLPSEGAPPDIRRTRSLFSPTELDPSLIPAPARGVVREYERMKPGETRQVATTGVALNATFKPLPAQDAPADIRGTRPLVSPTKLDPTVTPAPARGVLEQPHSSPSAQQSKTSVLLATRLAPPLSASKRRLAKAATAGAIARPGSWVSSERHPKVTRPREPRQQSRVQISAAFEPAGSFGRPREADVPQAAGVWASNAREREPRYPWVHDIAGEFDEGQRQQQRRVLPTPGSVNVPATIRTSSTRGQSSEVLIDYQTTASASGLPQAPSPFVRAARHPASIASLRATIRTPAVEPSPQLIPRQPSFQLLPPPLPYRPPLSVPRPLLPPPRSRRQMVQLLGLRVTTLPTEDDDVDQAGTSGGRVNDRRHFM